MLYSPYMDSFDIKKLAHMARIYITEEEGTKIGKSFASIIEYVDQIRDLDTANEGSTTIDLYNSARGDEDAAATSYSRDIIMDDMPFRDGDYLKVKKIL